jgi:hypothetical protein
MDSEQITCHYTLSHDQIRRGHLALNLITHARAAALLVVLFIAEGVWWPTGIAPTAISSLLYVLYVSTYIRRSVERVTPAELVAAFSPGGFALLGRRFRIATGWGGFRVLHAGKSMWLIRRGSRAFFFDGSALTDDQLGLIRSWSRSGGTCNPPSLPAPEDEAWIGEGVLSARFTTERPHRPRDYLTPVTRVAHCAITVAGLGVLAMMAYGLPDNWARIKVLIWAPALTMAFGCYCITLPLKWSRRDQSEFVRDEVVSVEFGTSGFRVRANTVGTVAWKQVRAVRVVGDHLSIVIKSSPLLIPLEAFDDPSDATRVQDVWRASRRSGRRAPAAAA